MSEPLRVPGLPSGAAAWRGAVADAAGRSVPARPPAALLLGFSLPSDRWVDLDTLVESSLRGLRDAGWYPRGHAGLDALLAVREGRGDPGLAVSSTSARAVGGRVTPGPPAVTVTDTTVPGPARAAKRAWRGAIGAAWGDRAPLDEDVWADLAVRTGGSLLGPLERLLDALEPVLGRDPRGREWQEFFPADHRITWLRVRRVATGPAVRLDLGPRAPAQTG